MEQLIMARKPRQRIPQAGSDLPLCPPPRPPGSVMVLPTSAVVLVHC